MKGVRPQFKERKNRNVDEKSPAKRQNYGTVKNAIYPYCCTVQTMFHLSVGNEFIRIRKPLDIFLMFC